MENAAELGKRANPEAVAVKKQEEPKSEKKRDKKAEQKVV